MARSSILQRNVFYKSPTVTIDPSHESHNILVRYPTLHHSVTDTRTSTCILQNGSLWDTRMMHCGIVQKVHLVSVSACSIARSTHPIRRNCLMGDEWEHAVMGFAQFMFWRRKNPVHCLVVDVSFISNKVQQCNRIKDSLWISVGTQTWLHSVSDHQWSRKAHQDGDQVSLGVSTNAATYKPRLFFV